MAVTLIIVLEIKETTSKPEKVTYKRHAGCQQQNPHQEVLKLLHHQLPQWFTCERPIWEERTDRHKYLMTIGS